ncbi:MAG TPA: hypothetical protein VLW50_08290 [Streptosporangiaceae bacterium]|nr:hypothetical protein [Streptosporangiaceae bacterium]
MRLTRVGTLLAAAVMALAITATATTTALATAPVSKGSSPVVVVSCAGHGQVRPTGYDVGCMANELLVQLRWTGWRSVAFGNGYLKVDNCRPSCARGTYVRYPILTVLWRATPWPRQAGRKYFSQLTWIFTGSRPGHAAAAQTITLSYM